MGHGRLEDDHFVKISFGTNAYNWNLKVIYDDNDTSVWENANLRSFNKLTLQGTGKRGRPARCPTNERAGRPRELGTRLVPICELKPTAASRFQPALNGQDAGRIVGFPAQHATADMWLP